MDDGTRSRMGKHYCPLNPTTHRTVGTIAITAAQWHAKDLWDGKWTFPISTVLPSMFLFIIVRTSRTVHSNLTNRAAAIPSKWREAERNPCAQSLLIPSWMNRPGPANFPSSIPPIKGTVQNIGTNGPSRREEMQSPFIHSNPVNFQSYTYAHPMGRDKTLGQLAVIPVILLTGFLEC